ncbi:hypothetical protein HUU39_12265 [candidate division KSB1 bacterium]|nr:hypothetical protein [candidate division KSB1 bacterium]
MLGQLRLQRLVHRLKLPEYTLFALAAVVTGGLAGLTAVGFHNAIEFRPA